MKASRLAALATLAMLTTSTAYAQVTSGEGDEKVIPASACRPASQLSASRLLYVSTGTVVNVSDQPASVVCPYVRDRVTERPHSLAVVVTNRNAQWPFQCTFNAMRPNGTALYARKHSTSTYGLRTFKAKWAQVPAWNPFHFDKRGLFYDRTPLTVSCFIPPRDASGYSAVNYLVIDELG